MCMSTPQELTCWRWKRQVPFRGNPVRRLDPSLLRGLTHPEPCLDQQSPRPGSQTVRVTHRRRSWWGRRPPEAGSAERGPGGWLGGLLPVTWRLWPVTPPRAGEARGLVSAKPQSRRCFLRTPISWAVKAEERASALSSHRWGSQPRALLPDSPG